MTIRNPTEKSSVTSVGFIIDFFSIICILNVFLLQATTLMMVIRVTETC